MTAIVVVSHSAALADAVVELAAQMGGADVPLVAVGGVDDPENPIGTDAMAVMEAISSLADRNGILVLVDLGSAVMAAETALDFLDDELRAKVRVSAAPLVEGTVSAAALAATGAGLSEVAAEAERALTPKQQHLATDEDEDTGGDSAPERKPDAGDTTAIRIEVTPPNGLHARPAVRFVQTAAAFDAEVSVRNLSNGKGPVNAASMVAVATLGAAQGHELEITATGPDAAAALTALDSLAAERFGD